MWTSAFWGVYWTPAYWPGPTVAVSASDFVEGNHRTWRIRKGSAGAIENSDGGLSIEVGESLLFDFDFSRKLNALDSISGTPMVTITPDVPQKGDVVVSGKRAQLLIEAGSTPGEYEVECVLTNSSGETVRGRGLLVVRADD